MGSDIDAVTPAQAEEAQVLYELFGIPLAESYFIQRAQNAADRVEREQRAATRTADSTSSGSRARSRAPGGLRDTPPQSDPSET